MSKAANNVMLVGGGHAHVAVLADWIVNGRPCQRASLLTPNCHLRYSGMVPGWIAGQYNRDDGVVDLAALAQRAGVQFIQGRCTGIDPDARRIKTGGGLALEYDLASFDTGGVGRAQEMLGQGEPATDKRLVDIRPIDRFVERIEAHGEAQHIAVVGGGAAGVEIAFALRNRGRNRGRNHHGAGAGPEAGVGVSTGSHIDVTLVAGRDGVLPGFSSQVRKKVSRELNRQGIAVVNEDARIEGGALLTGGGTGTGALEPQDLIIASLGSAAPQWIRHSGLAADAQGFIAVNQHQRSVSHPDVFAVGDVAARQDRDVAHSGVHAVMAGPVLAQNLRSVIKGGDPHAVYTPRTESLYLLSTGNGSAILSYGAFAAQGRWVAKLKASIDKRWISQYASLSG